MLSFWLMRVQVYVQAVSAALAPRMKLMGESEMLDDFSTFFTGRELVNGTQVLLLWDTAASTLEVKLLPSADVDYSAVRFRILLSACWSANRCCECPCLLLLRRNRTYRRACHSPTATPRSHGRAQCDKPACCRPFGLCQKLRHAARLA
jgi:hypothetical protein